MQTLTNSYLAKIAVNLAFLSVFIGGVAATFLASLLMVEPSKRLADWVVGSAALAAGGFIFCVVASVMLTIALNPDAPSNVNSATSIDTGRIVSMLGFVFGLIGLLTSIGLSGWLRSRKSGITTSSICLISLLLVIWAIVGFQ